MGSGGAVDYEDIVGLRKHDGQGAADADVPLASRNVGGDGTGDLHESSACGSSLKPNGRVGRFALGT